MAVLDSITEERVRRAVEILSRLAKVHAAYVFGSRVEGRADSHSDIDVAAFVEGLEEWDLKRRAQTAARVQKEAGDDLEIHFFRAADLENPPSASFASHVLRSGVCVSCYI